MEHFSFQALPGNADRDARPRSSSTQEPRGHSVPRGPWDGGFILPSASSAGASACCGRLLLPAASAAGASAAGSGSGRLGRRNVRRLACGFGRFDLSSAACCCATCVPFWPYFLISASQFSEAFAPDGEPVRDPLAVENGPGVGVLHERIVRPSSSITFPSRGAVIDRHHIGRTAGVCGPASSCEF